MGNKLFKTSTGSMHFALLIIRVSFGVFYMIHGWPKISGGVDTWTWLGGNMSIIGLGFAPAFWGFLAAVAEFFGGLLLIIGVLTRPVAAMMLFTMLIATLMHLQVGDPVNTVMNPLKGLVVFAAFLFSGAGKYSVDNMLSR
jgi:putative oxidoreductase